MKKSLFIIVTVFLLMGDLSIFSWDSTIAKYLPLQVGNTWIYYTYNQTFPMHGTGYNKYKITGLVESGGKQYYQVQQTYYHISGTPPGCGIPFINNIRIDSVTMNVYQLGGGCSSTERLIDSLFSKKNDTSWICAPVQFSRCTDTSAVLFLNISYPGKKYNNSGRGNSTVYTRGLGITYWGFSEAMSVCVDTLKGCVINGVLYGDTNTLVGLNQLSIEIPDKFSLSQNYPNPFNPKTNINFNIPHAGFVKLVIYDLLGKEVRILVNEQLTPGTYNADFDAGALPSCVYYYKLESEGFTETKKMVLIK